MKVARNSWHYKAMSWSANWELGWDWLNPYKKDNFCEYARGLLIGLPAYWILIVIASPFIGAILAIVSIYEGFKSWQYYPSLAAK